MSARTELEQALRVLERKTGVPEGTYDLDYYQHAGGYSIVYAAEPGRRVFDQRRRPAPLLIDVIRFAVAALDTAGRPVPAMQPRLSVSEASRDEARS